jgi:hypothetical protein
VSVIVFAGPSISGEEVAKLLPGSILRPPAAQGDLYLAAQERPLAIALIDGYFDRVPAVWHKEILWALAEGIPIFGASSMGALRAAELAALGMVGMGEVFEAFRTGVLEDDDEVAIAHGPSEFDYRHLSEAMVDIRSTLAAAELQGVISSRLAERILKNAKELYYPERTIAAALDRLSCPAASANQIFKLRIWLKTNFISVKHQDAVLLLKSLAELQRTGFTLPKMTFKFEYTELWQHAVQAAKSISETRTPLELSAEAVLDELRLQPALLVEAREKALLRCLAEDYLARQDSRFTATDINIQAETFRKSRGLEDAKDLQNWLDRHRLDRRSFLHLMTQELCMSRTEASLKSQLDAYILDYLHVTGNYEALSRRAEDKAQIEAALGQISIDDLDLDESELVAWFVWRTFEKPLSITAQDYADEAGFALVESLLTALAREYVYQTERPDDARS